MLHNAIIYPYKIRKSQKVEFDGPSGKSYKIVTTSKIAGGGRTEERLDQDEFGRILQKYVVKTDKFGHVIEKMRSLSDGTIDTDYSVTMKKNSCGRITAETYYHSNGNPAETVLYFKPGSKKEGYAEIHRFSTEGNSIEKKREYNNGKIEIYKEGSWVGIQNAM